jgi:hypothetical protein
MKSKDTKRRRTRQTAAPRLWREDPRAWGIAAASRVTFRRLARSFFRRQQLGEWTWHYRSGPPLAPCGAPASRRLPWLRRADSAGMVRRLVAGAVGDVWEGSVLYNHLWQEGQSGWPIRRERFLHRLRGYHGLLPKRDATPDAASLVVAPPEEQGMAWNACIYAPGTARRAPYVVLFAGADHLGAE